MAYCVILSTVASREEGANLLRLLLEKKLIACGNLVPGVESHYWWQGKIESAAEELIVIKTELAKADAVVETLRKNHSYEVPEAVVLPITSGNPTYLKWISDSLR